MISHSWNLTKTEAAALQNRLAAQVDITTSVPLDKVQLVAGVDVDAKDGVSHAAIVVLTFPLFEVVETVTASRPTTFPYISGFLSFREGPVILDAHRKLQHTPDVFIFDGQGIAHPRRLGIATHMGLCFDAPTVGCGKTWLIGDYTEPAAKKGSDAIMRDQGEVIGVVLRTRDNVKPVFVSPGHRITIDSARDLVLACCPRYRLPEPIRAADSAARRLSRAGKPDR